MGYIPNIALSASVDSLMTRLGRQVLSSNTDTFQISQFAFGDQEVNYQLLNVVNTDESCPNIENLPIPEPSTNENNELLTKIYLNQTFLGDQYQNATTTQAQYVDLQSAVGNPITLYSDDTTTKIAVWVASFDALGRPYVAPSYTFAFTTSIDCFTVQFTNPPLTDTTNLNWTQNGNTYTFNAQNSDGSGVYTATQYGSPSIVFSLNFTQTPNYYTLASQPQNSSSISVPTFLTVTQIDSTGAPITDIAPGMIGLSIINTM